jgi:hypothetical protein
MVGMRMGRRIITRVIVFLLLGAIVNVAVAWGCTWWASGDRLNFDPGGFQARMTAEELRSLNAGEVEAPIVGAWQDHSSVGVLVREASLVHTDWLKVGLFDEEGGLHPLGLSVQAGLPFHTLGGWTNLKESRDSWVLRIPGRATGSWPDPALPLRPLWPGFGVNTMFYAGILWLLFAAPFALRRRRRIKRGLCPACAYPVGDSEVCTECGGPVRTKAVPA